MQQLQTPVRVRLLTLPPEAGRFDLPIFRYGEYWALSSLSDKKVQITSEKPDCQLLVPREILLVLN